MSGALDGIRVIDCGVVQLGPTAGTLLGDLGADVIKVEPPVTGEMGRGIEILAGAASRIQTGGSHFEAWNRNKRGMTIDLKKSSGRDIFYKLVATADVILNNWRKGVAEELNVDYQTIRKHNRNIIYAYASPWGLKGADSDDQAMDFAAIARSGMAYQVGKPDDPPLIFVSGYADTTAAIILVQAILAALLVRERTGVAQMVDTSLLGSMVAGLERLPVNSRVHSGMEMPRRDRTKMGNPLWNYYKCSDDKWIALAMLAADRYWSSFCKALDITEYENDPRFSDIEVRSQEENSKQLIEILDGVFATGTQDEWLRKMKEHRLICTRIQTISDLLSDPQVVENEYIMEYEHPAYGRIKTVGFPWHFSETPPRLRLPAPQLGEHTEQILLELGYTWNDIEKFKEQEAI
jgi:crotonobetainyl-CoA:carnitine CoA-transferase CaiB-like acyl-CoA transferase